MRIATPTTVQCRRIATPAPAASIDMDEACGLTITESRTITWKDFSISGQFKEGVPDDKARPLPGEVYVIKKGTTLVGIGELKPSFDPGEVFIYITDASTQDVQYELAIGSSSHRGDHADILKELLHRLESARHSTDNAKQAATELAHSNAEWEHAFYAQREALMARESELQAARAEIAALKEQNLALAKRASRPPTHTETVSPPRTPPNHRAPTHARSPLAQRKFPISDEDN
ncbi:MAG: hypothetical protein O3A01_00335 [bacterium]|nr:hypothetical protein [bacterium]